MRGTNGLFQPIVAIPSRVQRRARRRQPRRAHQNLGLHVRPHRRHGPEHWDKAGAWDWLWNWKQSTTRISIQRKDDDRWRARVTLDPEVRRTSRGGSDVLF